jgi:hypothetical protein
MHDPANGLRRIPLLRLYEKVSNTREPPRHEADHGSVHQRLPARTRALLVFAHPSVLLDPQAIVLSTTHLLGSTTKPLGGNSFCQSTPPRPPWPTPWPTPSTRLLQRAFWGPRRDPHSIPGSYAPSQRPCPLRGSPHPPTGERGQGIADPPLAVAS